MSQLARAIVEYIILVVLIAFFLPLVWPTDVPPPGAPPDPWYVPVVGILAIYFFPLTIVLPKLLRQWRR